MPAVFLQTEKEKRKRKFKRTFPFPFFCYKPKQRKSGGFFESSSLLQPRERKTVSFERLILLKLKEKQKDHKDPFPAREKQRKTFFVKLFCWKLRNRNRKREMKHPKRKGEKREEGCYCLAEREQNNKEEEEGNRSEMWREGCSPYKHNWMAMIACFWSDLRAEKGFWAASLVRCCMTCEELKRREPCEQGSYTYMVTM